MLAPLLDVIELGVRSGRLTLLWERVAVSKQAPVVDDVIAEQP